jgi:predicted metal-dependent phosphoesterase TrpH
VAVAAGTLSDVPRQHSPVVLGGYRVLAADFHVHTFPLSASTLAPWDVVFEARRQGLDVLAITGHNEVFAGKLGRWFSRWAGGPTVLAGEEIHAPGYHLIAVGIETTVSWRLNAVSAIDEIHRQHGIAIAAHPTAKYWAAFDAAAMGKLDGAEIVQPISYSAGNANRDMQEFLGRRRLTAIGSSDYHGVGPVGLCRTYVFTREASEQGILEALRQGHTVVYDRGGHAYGDPERVRLAAQEGGLGRLEDGVWSPGFLVMFSRTCGLLGMLGVVLFGFGATSRRPPAPSFPST